MKNFTKFIILFLGITMTISHVSAADSTICGEDYLAESLLGYIVISAKLSELEYITQEEEMLAFGEDENTEVSEFITQEEEMLAFGEDEAEENIFTALHDELKEMIALAL